MKNTTKRGFLVDHEGKPSSMRIMSAVSLGAAIVLSILIAIGTSTNDATVDLVLYFLIAAFTPKAVQSFAEKKKAVGDNELS